MTPRLEPHLRPPIAFAHRGGRAHNRENTMEAFAHALEAGVGIESDAWLSADGAVVLDHDGVVGHRLGRRRRVRDLARDDLPNHMPTLTDVYERFGTHFALSLDLKDVEAGDQVLATAEAAGALARLWICVGGDLDVLADQRERWPHARLCHSTRLKRMRKGPERHAAELARIGIAAVNLPHADWTGGLTTLFHRFGVLAFGWDAHRERQIDELLTMGIDAVYSDRVDLLAAAMRRWYP